MIGSFHRGPDPALKSRDRYQGMSLSQLIQVEPMQLCTCNCSALARDELTMVRKRAVAVPRTMLISSVYLEKRAMIVAKQ